MVSTRVQVRATRSCDEGRKSLRGTYSLGAVQHAHIEIPQAQPAVFAHAAETIVLLVAAPRVKGDRSDPGLMALATSNDGRVDDGPYGDQIVLAAREDVFPVGGPAYGYETAVVRVEEVKKPRRDLVSMPDQSGGEELTPLSSSR